MTKIVMVDVLTSFRNRYAVELNDEDPAEWAVDTVVCEMHDVKLTEFSQYHIGDQVMSHREITKEEYLRMFDEDNDYLKDWTEKQKLSFINNK